jgi:hypothetical protein
MTAKRKAILKLKELVSLGHVPNRGLEEYTHVTTYNQKVASMVNCFGHAVFNLSNKELEQLHFTEKEGHIFGDIWCDAFIPTEFVENQLLKIIKNTGLSATEITQVIKPNEKLRLRNNQWRIALYIDYSDRLEKDFHFFLQEKDNSWTSKQGYSDKIQHLENLPKQYNDYDYYKSYIITNPYANEKREF